MKTPLKLRVLVYPDADNWWTARGLEHDIGACSLFLAHLPGQLERVLKDHLQSNKNKMTGPLSDIFPAPAIAEVHWDRGVPVAFPCVVPGLTLEFRVGDPLQ